MQASTTRHHCVLLAPAGADVSVATSTIEARGWNVDRATNPFRAFASLCVHEQIQRNRCAWGLERAERLALIIIGFDQNETTGVMKAMSDHLPGALVQSLLPGSEPDLPEVRTSAPNVPEAPVHPALVSGVELHLAVDHRKAGRPLPRSSTQPEIGVPNPVEERTETLQITSEELQMLLSEGNDTT